MPSVIGSNAFAACAAGKALNTVSSDVKIAPTPVARARRAVLFSPIHEV
jgi:hypothetical protein